MSENEKYKGKRKGASSELVYEGQDKVTGDRKVTLNDAVRNGHQEKVQAFKKYYAPSSFN